MIEILYGGGVAVLTIGDSMVELNRELPANEERYSGKGWRWVATGARDGELRRTDDPAPTTRCRVG